MGFLDNLGNLKGNLGTQRESPEIRMTLENIARADGEIQEKIFQLGQKYYEENKNKETGELSQPYASIIDAVKKLEENRKGFFKNKLRLEGQMMCENCDAIIPYGSVFCNQCGKKADEVSDNPGKPETYTENAKCRQCGAALEEGSQFCMSCGAKVE